MESYIRQKRICRSSTYGYLKAFDTINHDLLIAKLNAYGFTKNSLRLIKSYFSNHWQRTKVNTSFSTWTELLLGVPQRSVRGPLLFNIYINDLFFLTESTSVCNYADYTTFHACDMDLENFVRRLNLLLSGHKHEMIWANIGQTKIWESRKQTVRNNHWQKFAFWRICFETMQRDW